MGLDDVLSDLEGEGYAWEAFVIPACAVQLPQGRQRIWFVADTMRRDKKVARLFARGRWEPEQISWDQMGEMQTTPDMVGVPDGLPHRMDRLKALGNAVVPQIPEMIGRAILEIESGMPGTLQSQPRKADGNRQAGDEGLANTRSLAAVAEI